MKRTTSTNTRPRFILGVLIPFVLSAASLRAPALPSYGANCQASGCHTTLKNGMAVTNHQTVANLGSGLLKVFKVSPGQTAAIQLNVTNRYGGNYGLTINNLGNAGLTNAADHLAYTADASWANRTTYFTVGPTANGPPYLWTFNLGVQASTPTDTYVVQTMMAGRDSSSVRWSQAESFYVQVVPNTPPRPLLANPKRSGTTFTVGVPTTSGFTYYLEYRTSVTNSTWTSVSQVSGDGTTKTLSDTAASNPQCFYRVRVQ